MLIGYALVLIDQQDHVPQLDALRGVRCEGVTKTESGTWVDRPELAKAMEQAVTRLS
jgi:hypothetical protein